MMPSLRASVMSRQPLVLLVASDRLAVRSAKQGLEGYGYDVLVAGDVEEARAILRTEPRISTLVLDVKLDNPAHAMDMAKAARAGDPGLHVIYTCGMPYRLPEREKVRGAPCLRTPYHPHQLASVIGQISQRAEAHAA
jgi:DNA-binding NtrC family response regulator